MKKIQPAERVSNIQEYYFSIKLKEIAAMNARGENVISLGIGSPDLPPSKETIETLQKSAELDNMHGYQPYVGISELREAYATWYNHKYGVEVNPSNEVLPLLGSKEGIMHISMAFLNSGDGVLVPNPGYPTYSSAAKIAGGTIYNYSLKEENGWYPDFDAIEAADAAGEISLENTKIMWCNYPNMPTGANATPELFERLVAFGKKHNILICHDNPYSFILNPTPMSIMATPGAKDVCLEMNSMSKCFNMPGWRIGVVVAQPQFIQWILKIKSNMDSGMFKPMQLAAVTALNAPQEWYDQLTDIYKRRRVIANRILEAIGATVDKNQVGMFAWGRLKSCDTPEGEIASKIVSDKILYEAKVFITPGLIFGDEGNNYMRVSLCCKEETLQEALERIQKIF